MARRVYYLEDRRSLQTRDEGYTNIKIDDRFAELCRNVPHKKKCIQRKDLHLKGDESSFVHSAVCKYLRKLSNRELKLFTGLDTIRIPYTQTKTIRNILIDSAVRCIYALSDEHLKKVYNCIPFSVHLHPSITLSAKDDELDSEEDERDWDCRPTTVGEVTKEDLDRELDEYFMRDPERYRQQLDREIDEYMSKG
jgi:hypothetical protein